MGRRRRGRRNLGALSVAKNAKSGAISAIRGKRNQKNTSTKKAQVRVNKAASAAAGALASPKNLGGATAVNTRSKDINLPNPSKAAGVGGGKGAMNPSQRFSKPQAGVRGRGKNPRPIAENERTMEGGGYRNRAFGMGREQRGYGMGREKPNFGGNTAFGMGRDQRAAGMGSQEMMRNRGYNSGMASSARPSKGSMQPIKQPEGRPMDPSLGGPRATSPRASRSTSIGGSSFNPASGRMEYASQPNNFSRSSQRPASIMFRKNMGTTQGAFKLPAKSQIKK
jgi:hypothetical protein